MRSWVPDGIDLPVHESTTGVPRSLTSSSTSGRSTEAELTIGRGATGPGRVDGLRGPPRSTAASEESIESGTLEAGPTAATSQLHGLQPTVDFRADLVHVEVEVVGATVDLALRHPGHVARGHVRLGTSGQADADSRHDVLDALAAGELLGLEDRRRQRHPGLAAIAVGEAHAGAAVGGDAATDALALDDAAAVDVLADDDERRGAIGVGHESSPSVRWP